VFKSWFRRKASDQPAPQSSAQPTPQPSDQLMKPAAIQLLYIIQEDLAAKNEVLKLLVDKGLFDLESPLNGLFLSTDPGLAKATQTPLYPADYTPINDMHDAILREFGRRPTAFGMTNLQLMKSAPRGGRSTRRTGPAVSGGEFDCERPPRYHVHEHTERSIEF
jgi:hypothetical protein